MSAYDYGYSNVTARKFELINCSFKTKFFNP